MVNICWLAIWHLFILPHLIHTRLQLENSESLRIDSTPGINPSLKVSQWAHSMLLPTMIGLRVDT